MHPVYSQQVLVCRMSIDHGWPGDKTPRIWSKGTLMQIVPPPSDFVIQVQKGAFCGLQNTPKSVFDRSPLGELTTAGEGTFLPIPHPTRHRPTFGVRHASPRIPARSTPVVCQCLDYDAVAYSVEMFSCVREKSSSSVDHRLCYYADAELRRIPTVITSSGATRRVWPSRRVPKTTPVSTDRRDGRQTGHASL